MAREDATVSAALDLADEVRAFYESHSYRAPFKNLNEHRKLYQNPDRHRALSLHLWPTEKPRADRDILVAGRRTSQAAAYAMREPDAHVTGIHISEASLGQTRQPQRKYGLHLHRLAIEEAGNSAGRSMKSSAPACCITCPTRTPAFAPCVACSSPIGLCMSWSMGLMGALLGARANEEELQDFSPDQRVFR